MLAEARDERGAEQDAGREPEVVQGNVGEGDGCGLDPGEVEAQLGSGVVGEPGGCDGDRGGGCDGGCGSGAAGRGSGDRAHQGVLRRVVASAVSAAAIPWSLGSRARLCGIRTTRSQRDRASWRRARTRTLGWWSLATAASTSRAPPGGGGTSLASSA